MVMKVVAATRNIMEVLMAEIVNPTLKMAMESNIIARRPYTSESLPKSNVAAAPASPGSASNHAKSAIPSNSATMPGWAIFLALAKSILTNSAMKIAHTRWRSYFGLMDRVV